MKCIFDNNEIVKKIFKLLMILLFLYLILGEFFLSDEITDYKANCIEYTTGWNVVDECGKKIPTQIPGKYDAKRKQKICIENKLPENITDNTFICTKSLKQDMKIYVDDELREEYNTSNTRLFGKTSAFAFVFAELEKDDAGKIIRIETSTDSSYTGVFYEIYYGDKLGIWLHFFKMFGAESIVAIFTVMLGIFSILASVIAKVYYNKNIKLEYLGWGILIVSSWLIANSAFRQIIFSNISVIGDMTFFLIMLFGLPFTLYMDDIQEKRYHKIYVSVQLLTILDFIVCTVLHITNTIDFADTIIATVICCGMSTGVIVVAIIVDIVNKNVKRYYFVAIGIIGFMLSGGIQLVIYFKRTMILSGIIIAVGLIFLLICASINEIINVEFIEKEKIKAVLSNESKGKFLANMSHEIRTPINVILGMDAMILRESKESKVRDYAQDIQDAGQTLLALINDILDISKIESGKMEIIPVEYELSNILHEVINMGYTKIEEKKIDFKVLSDDLLPNKLYGDEVRIKQILINLVSNAIKYTNEGTVTLKIEGNRREDAFFVKFIVEDTGIGIKEEDIPRLFEEFERIEEERNRNIEGTGLGMNISINLLKMMGSKLEVSSIYGKGSTFSFEIEQKIIDNEPIGNLEERIQNRTIDYIYNATFIAPNARILIVDDNDINRKVFINLLKETHIKIDDVDNGKECLKNIKKKHYDIIFLDHLMPEMDGIETLKHIKEDKTHMCGNTPTVALTANAISGTKEMYIREGFEQFLSKPINPEKLEEIIVNLLPKEKILMPEKIEQDVEDNIDKELPFIDGVDWDYAKMHMKDVEMLLKTVSDFHMLIDKEADMLEEFYNNIRENNENEEMIKQYKIKVHSMKSSAAFIGITSLCGMAKILENSAANKKNNNIIIMTPIFLEEWRGFKKKLEIVIYDKKEVVNKKKLTDNRIVLKYLDILEEAIKDMKIDVMDDTFSIINEYEYDSDTSKYTQQLQDAVNDLNIEKCIELVNKIKEKLVHL